MPYCGWPRAGSCWKVILCGPSNSTLKRNVADMALKRKHVKQHSCFEKHFDVLFANQSNRNFSFLLLVKNKAFRKYVPHEIWKHISYVKGLLLENHQILNHTVPFIFWHFKGKKSNASTHTTYVCLMAGITINHLIIS